MTYLDDLILLQCRSDQVELKLRLRAVLSEVGFNLDTCLRTIWVTDRTDLVAKLCDDDREQKIQVFQGKQAYEHFLRIACGLESAVKGETEVFAQLKSSWKEYAQQQSEFAVALQPWVQKLFSDTKDVRKTFLEGIGGASYGSLARKICNPEANDRVLIIGTGNLGQAVAPLFGRYELFLWNRDKRKLDAVLKKYSARKSARVVGVTDEQLVDCIARVDHVIICTPAGLPVENEWIRARMQGKQSGKVVHLGGKAYLTTRWECVKGFSSLSDVFNLQTDQNKVKQERLTRAIDACKDKAEQRHLMDAIAMNHGWEDLVAF